ncbi:MAG: hypothetical protein ACPF88_08005 [Flavobacteriaceae bacterium]
MKKLLLFLLVLSSTQFSIAQTETQLPKDISERRHELKLDAIKLLSIPAIELNYEYIKDVNQGFGATLLLNMDDENYFEKFSFSPYFRFYFNTNQEYGAKGFFVKAFTSFYSGRDLDYFLEEQRDDYFDIAIGFAVGQKLINKSGFVFEYFIGAGRNLLGNSDETIMAKFGVNVGYRF